MAFDVVEPAATMGIGALPHRSAGAAAEFGFDAFDIPTVPSLPRRSPAESPIAQALAGVPGVSMGQYGALAVDVDRLDVGAPVATDLHGDHFGGFRAFLEVAAERRYAGPVKWQFVGPLSVGVALVRAGADPDLAFEVAAAAVTAHLTALAAAVDTAVPGGAQIVVLDEPFVDGLLGPDFPVPPDLGIDLLSSAMASVEHRAVVGVHTCADSETTALLEAGPGLLSLPVSTSVVPMVPLIERFLQGGGWIAWGAIATEGPIGVTSTRSWHQLSTVWCELVQRGCDPERLRRQSILTPQCGLGSHSPVVAERVCRSLRDVSRSVRSATAAARLLLGG